MFIESTGKLPIEDGFLTFLEKCNFPLYITLQQSLLLRLKTPKCAPDP